MTHINYSKLMFYLGGLVVITLPLKNIYNSIVVILFLLSATLVLLKNRGKLPKLKSSVFLLVLPFIYLLFQGLYSDSEVYLDNLIRFLPILAFPICFYYLSHLINIQHFKNKVFSLFVWSSIIYSLYLLLVAFYRQIDFSPNFDKINWYFFAYHDFTEALSVQPTYFGLYNCLAISVLLVDTFKNNEKVLRNMIIVVFLILILLLSGSRISLLSLIVICTYLFFTFFKQLQKKTIYKLLILAFIIPISVFKYVPIVKERMIDMTFGVKETFSYAKYGINTKYDGGISPRLEMWNCAINITADKILFGNGFGHTQKLLNSCYRQKGFDSFANLNYQTHNLYLNNYARGGIVGVLVLLVLYFYSVGKAWLTNNKLYMSFLILIIATSITENILNMQFGIVFFAFFNSVFFFDKKHIK